LAPPYEVSQTSWRCTLLYLAVPCYTLLYHHYSLLCSYSRFCCAKYEMSVFPTQQELPMEISSRLSFLSRLRCRVLSGLARLVLNPMSQGYMYIARSKQKEYAAFETCRFDVFDPNLPCPLGSYFGRTWYADMTTAPELKGT